MTAPATSLSHDEKRKINVLQRRRNFLQRKIDEGVGTSFAHDEIAALDWAFESLADWDPEIGIQISTTGPPIRR